jgi:NAD(P) transhydrogenase subunit alpha
MIEGMTALYIFMLAAVAGYEIIGRVPVILHTPLMSGSNFVHGIVLVGAMVALGQASGPLEQVVGFIGVALVQAMPLVVMSLLNACWKCSRAAKAASDA